MATLSWLGGPGRWGNAAQWSGGTVPQGGDVAVIAAAGTYVIQVDDAEAAASVTLADPGARLLTQPPPGGASTLAVAGTIALSAGSLDVQVGSTIRAAAIDVKGGTLLLEGGTLDGVAVLGTISSNAFLHADFQNTLTNDGTLSNGYVVSLAGDTFFNNGTVVVQQLTIAAASTVTPLVFVNTGVFVTGQTVSDDIGFDSYYSPRSSGAYFVNEGVLTSYGTLTIRLQNAINSGQMFVAGGGLLDLQFAQAGGGTLGASGSLSNYGAIHVAAGAMLGLALPGAFTLASLGSIDNQGGTVRLESGTLDLGGGTLDLSGAGALGAVQLAGVTITDGTLTAPDGYAVGTVTLDGATWIGALAGGNGAQIALLNGARVLSPTGGLARITGNVTLDTQTLHQTALNVGAVTLAGNATLDAGSVLATDGSSLASSQTNASLTLQGRAYVLANEIYASTLVLHNPGTVVLAGGAIAQLGSVDGPGLIEIAGGTLEPGTIAAGQTVSFAGSGVLALNAIYTFTYGPNYGRVLTPSSFAATVQNFGAGDTIDLGRGADSLSFAGGVLTASAGGTIVASIQLAGTYATSDFQLASSTVPYVPADTLVTTTKAGQPGLGAPVITVGPAPVIALTGSPLAGVTISDPDPTSIDAVTVSPNNSALVGVPLGSAGPAFSAPTGFLASGTASDLTRAIDGVTGTLYFNRPAIDVGGYSITAANLNGATTAIQPATFLNQYGAYANLAAGAYAVSASPDGAAAAAPVAGKVNEVFAAAPQAGGAVFLPAGYQAAYAGGASGITLADPGYGNAVLADAGGNDLIYAAGDGDVLVGGTGSDTLVATQGALIEATATSGSTLIFGGAGATTIFGPSLPPSSFNATTQATIVSGSGDSTVIAQARHDLVALGSGRTLLSSLGTDTIFAGAGASTITTSGRDSAPAFAVLGSGTSVVYAGTGSTVLGGMGASTVALGFNATMFGGAGPALVSLTYVDQFIGGAGSATVFGQGGLVSGGTAGHNFIQMTEQNDIASNAFGGGDGDTLVSAPYTTYAAPYIYPTNLVAGSGNETLIASAGTKNTALLAGPGSDVVQEFGATGTVLGGTGSAAISLGGGLYSLVFDAGRGGGSSIITGFDATRDTIRLAGYAPGIAGAALAGASVAQGSETLALGDGTRITLVGFSGLTATTLLQ